jgi:quercetin dioxygenase-like cupin family protein
MLSTFRAAWLRFGAILARRKREAVEQPRSPLALGRVRIALLAATLSQTSSEGMRAMDDIRTESYSPTSFAHTKPGDTEFISGGLRDFFEYRDLGIAAATNGKVIAQLVRAKDAPESGTGWHRHVADFHIVLMLKGWARFMYEDKVTLVNAGDCVHQRPGIVHFLFDYSPDMEYLEIAGPADFKTIPMPGPCPVPEPTPWK